MVDLVARAVEAASGPLRHFASIVDAENRFPRESIEALREMDFFRFMVPERFGGLPSTYADYSRIAATLGDGCVSTAVIWAMHCQQVLTIADHSDAEYADVLSDIAAHGSLIASITTEPQKGGDQLSAIAPLLPENGRFRVKREGPTVSFGGESRYYLVTMRVAEDRPHSDVRLVLVTRDDEGTIEVTGTWDALGVHGTRTVPMRFDVIVDPRRIVGGDDYRDVALRTIIPAGQLGCASAWYGAARGSLRRYLRWARGRPHGLGSDLVASKLARMRLALDLVGALLERTAARLDRLRAARAPLSEYETPSHIIELNNAKVAASETAVATLNELIELSGVREGYIRDGVMGLERVYRDVRSGTLMFGNERLLATNARLMILESTPLRLGARS